MPEKNDTRPLAPGSGADVGMVARYASLAVNYLERYLEENGSNPGKTATPALALQEMKRIAGLAQGINMDKITPAEKHRKFGRMCLEEGPTQVHNTFAIVAGAIETIAKKDRDREGPLTAGQSERKGLVENGALNYENFRSLAKGLFASMRYVGSSMGEALALPENRVMPTPRAPGKLAVPLMKHRGRPQDKEGFVLADGPKGMTQMIANALEKHGIQHDPSKESKAGWCEYQIRKANDFISTAEERGRNAAKGLQRG